MCLAFHPLGRCTLIALWDGKAGSGPGGTKNLVEIARIFVSTPGITFCPHIRIVTVVALFIGPWWAVHRSLTQFRSQKWWERRQQTYWQPSGGFVSAPVLLLWQQHGEYREAGGLRSLKRIHGTGASSLSPTPVAR